jgi:hypothetical protein
MRALLNQVAIWWDSLTHPERAARLVLEPTPRPGFDRALFGGVVFLYMLYGLSMGLFRGWGASCVSAAKLPFLFILTISVCLPPFYTLNCLDGPRLTLRQSLRLLLLATSANALALASYMPVSVFFTLTTSYQGYSFLVLMHVAVFALAALASLAVVTLIFRATAAERGRRLRPRLVLSWGILYAFVGTQMSWMLRPWIGSRSAPYTLFRPRGGSFIEAVWTMLTT